MSDAEIVQVGTDSSGRKILMTRRMQSWWAGVVAQFGYAPTITQGAWMAQAGGGAAASAGYHDGGGCLDLRVRDLRPGEATRLIRVLRARGAAAWLRDEAHGGFRDPHIHLVLGSDHGLTTGARWQWSEYLAGRSGLASRGADYHWRPDPIVTTPPREDWFDMATKDELAQVVRAVVREEIDRALNKRQGNDRTVLGNIRAGGNARDLAKEIAAELKRGQG